MLRHVIQRVELAQRNHRHLHRTGPGTRLILQVVVEQGLNPVRLVADSAMLAIGGLDVGITHDPVRVAHRALQVGVLVQGLVDLGGAHPVLGAHQPVEVVVLALVDGRGFALLHRSGLLRCQRGRRPQPCHLLRGRGACPHIGPVLGGLIPCPRFSRLP